MKQWKMPSPDRIAPIPAIRCTRCRTGRAAFLFSVPPLRLYLCPRCARFPSPRPGPER